MPPADVRDYLGLVRDALQVVSCGRLRAVYLHGSAALGGWVQGRSDVDVLVVVADEASVAIIDAVARTLVDTAAVCPGRGLESSIVTVTQISQPQPPWPFLAHVATGTGEPVIISGTKLPGDPDLLMHYAVSRAAGWAAYGPAPRDLIGSIERQAVLGYLATELDWGLAHGPEAYAVLNACRAAIYMTDGEIVSKVAGGQIALARESGPADLIERALRQQLGESPHQPPRRDAAEFVRATAADLRLALAGSHDAG